MDTILSFEATVHFHGYLRGSLHTGRTYQEEVLWFESLALYCEVTIRRQALGSDFP